MLTCRTRRSTSPRETFPSTSARRSSPATTCPPRSPRLFDATSTSKRDGEKASTRSSSGSGPARAARSGSSASSWVSGTTRRRAGVETFRVYRGRTGKYVVHIERRPGVDDGRRRRASRLDGAATSASATSATGQSPGRIDARSRRVPRRAPRRGSRSSSTTWSPRRPASRRSKTSTSDRPPRVGAGRRGDDGHGTPDSAIRAVGLRKSYGKQVVLDGIDLDIADGTVYALLGPNGAGKTTTVHILSTLIAADGGEARVDGHDVAREPDAVRAVIGLTGQFSAVDGLFTGEENLQLMADLRHLGKAGGPPAGRRAARAVRPRRRREEAGRDLLGRHAAAARPGHDPRRRPADHLPRRADRRTRSAQPARHVGDDPGPRRGRRHHLPDHAIPRGGGPARRSHRRPRPGRLVAEGTPDELKRLVPGGHVQLVVRATRPSSSAPRAYSTGHRATTRR